MAKKESNSQTNSLVIVESPAKARTIGKFLGSGFTIEASIGHIRDLPNGAKEVPEEFKQEDWAYLGVNVTKDFDPIYIIPAKKAQQVRKLKAALKGATDLYLATDEDREGEAISWHLCEVLNPKVPVHRLVFHEITEEAIRDALKHPRSIDQALVRAQEVRRIVDRLYGYDVSPLLWRKIKPKLSAGRVQSVAVRLIVERERQRMAFRAATYWDLVATFAKSGGEAFEAVLVSVEGRKIPAGRDFDPATGQLKDPTCLLLNERQASELAAKLRSEASRVAELEDKPYTTRPYPPFTTSTLQQEGNRKYGFTARRTMDVAQSLYENGHITYMRTDSTNLATVAIETARQIISSQYGKEYLPDRPRIYQTKVKNAQEAHEAIRPAGHPFVLPETLRNVLSPDEFRLYDLIWKRTVASQMSDARARRITISVVVDGARFEASGKIIDFPGYLRAYVEGSDDPDSELAGREVVLPPVTVGEALHCRQLQSKSHTTQPPNRYSEASLTRALEEMGIGRPSTYASIIDTILARDYVFKGKRGNVLVPTWTAFAVSQLLEAHLPDLVNYQFTAEMEDELDAISRGELDSTEYLRHFYYGKDKKGLKDLVATKTGEIDARDVCRVLLGKPEGQPEVFVRVGRYGPFLEQGDRRASIPEQTPPDELSLETSLKMLETSAQSEEPLGHDSDGKPVYLKTGRFGPYVQRGNSDEEEKPQNASLLKGMQPEDVTIDVALKLLLLPRTLGQHPQSGEPIVAYNGRFGPYIKCDTETRSLPAGLSPLEVTFEQAMEFLAQPKVGGRGGTAKREPLRVFEVSPVTNNPVHLLAGKYGPYLTDGVTNATLPRGTAPEEVTLEYALNLLKARAEQGPSKRPARRTAKKAAAPKKAARKKTAKKTVKKTAKKSE
ncbi:MAG: type I DNA topoisomerase [Planctomycetota bacterium]